MRLIDADKFKGFIKTVPSTYTRTEGYIYLNGCRKILEIIDAAPTIDPESLRPTAHWIKRGYVCGENEYECSACHETEWRTSASRMKYCMFCGARMEGRRDE